MPEAVRARHILPFLGQGPARSPDSLYAPVRVMEDAVLLTSCGRIIGLESYADFNRRAAGDFELKDLGEACLAPGLINAHCHLELSYLAGGTLSGRGFAAWLESMVSLLRQNPGAERPRRAVAKALDELAASGVVHTGDVSSRMAPELSAMAASLAGESGLPYPLMHFLEAIGFVPKPDNLTAEGYAPFSLDRFPPERRANLAVAGHALYSTGPDALRAASSWCWERGKVFSLHLAESDDEAECLESGSGPLYELLRESLLPPGWKAPGLSPAEYAEKLHLLSPFTLAVHCARLSDKDMKILARNGVSVCLCPRSNEYIGVGRAGARELARAGVLLCLGTDGLCSNHDLDMQKEMLAAVHDYDLPGAAVLRMATLNGAYALGLGALGSLTPGNAAAWCVLRPELADAVLLK